jgi:SAM-dependent methyltransferase
MSTQVDSHYRSLLASRYTWMMGGLERCLASARELLESAGVLSTPGPVLDLGCGPGYHAQALAQSGARVIAVDNSEDLLRELGELCAGLDVVPVLAELSDPASFAARAPFSTILCVGDTITHLGTLGDVETLLSDCARWLAPGGALVLEFREQPRDLRGQDAVLTLRAERDRIMQCVLHFEPERVWITDVVHEWSGDRWRVFKSTYPKLRLNAAWIASRAAAAGLQVRSDLTRAGRRVLVLTRR